MKYGKPLYIGIGITALIFFAQNAFAQTSINVSGNGSGVKTNVNVETNTGQNTICQNGKCTTSTPSNGTSKVCVNGVCHTSEDGNFNYESENGTTKININNSSSTNNATKNSIESNVNVNTNTSNNESQKIAEKKNIEEKHNAIEKLIIELKNFFKNFRFF